SCHRHALATHHSYPGLARSYGRPLRHDPRPLIPTEPTEQYLRWPTLRGHCFPGAAQLYLANLVCEIRRGPDLELRCGSRDGKASAHRWQEGAERPPLEAHREIRKLRRHWLRLLKDFRQLQVWPHGRHYWLRDGSRVARRQVQAGARADRGRQGEASEECGIGEACPLDSRPDS